MTADSSNNRGENPSRPSFSGCRSLDAIWGEMFQNPSLLELESTLERHPAYHLYKLKQQLTRRPAFMLGLDTGRHAAQLGPTSSLDDQQVRSPMALSAVPFGIKAFKARGLFASLSTAPAVRKSRRGRKHRAGGLTCQEQMILLAEADPTVMLLKAPGIHARMVARWGEADSFCVRKIQDEPLYDAWQFEVEKLRKDLKMSQADFAEEGLAILSHKPGREDKRRVGRAQYEQMTRAFLAAMENTNIASKRKTEAAKAARNQQSAMKFADRRGSRK